MVRERISLRLPPNLKRFIQQAAAENYRSQNAELVAILVAAMTAQAERDARAA